MKLFTRFLIKNKMIEKNFQHVVLKVQIQNLL